MADHELLDLSAARLMTAELVERYNRLASVLVGLGSHDPTLAGSSELVALRKDLARTHRLMSRLRFPVIFCGRSQVGKSTTLSHIVRAGKGEEPCLGGSGVATTCVVTRIHAKTRLAGAAGSRRREHDCKIRFLTRAEYEARVKGIRDYLGYAPDLDDNVVLNDLSRLLVASERRTGGASGASGGDVDANDLADRLADRRYLRRLMLSHRTHGAGVVLDAPDGLTQPGVFARRIEYTNHPDDDVATLHTLLGEVEIAYEVDPGVLDPRIELADSPGLGARLIVDDLVTQRILPEVEGALIVIDVGNVAIREVYELLETFGRRFGTLEGRVWLLVTKLDSLTSNHYRPESRPDGQSRSIFDHIANTARENGLPLSQVVLISNTYHEFLPRKPDGMPDAATPEMMRVTLKLELDPAGQPILPESVRRYPELERAFREVIRDGGIDRVRQIVGRELAGQVQDRARDRVGRDLERLAGRLRSHLEAARRVAQLERGALGKLGEWIGTIDTLMSQVEHDPEGAMIEGPGRELIQDVWKSWTARYPDARKLLNGQPAAAHNLANNVLHDRIRQHSTVVTIPKVFDNIGERLRASEATHGPVPLGSDEGGPTSAWEKAKDDYLKDENTPFLAIVDESKATENPFKTAVQGVLNAGLDDDEYRKLMRSKLEITVRAAIYALGEDVRARLKAFRDDLEQMERIDRNAPVRGKTTAAPGARTVYDDLLEALTPSPQPTESVSKPVQETEAPTAAPTPIPEIAQAPTQKP